jgi:integrating conjugative element protein (TIGR03759 family)
MKLNKKLIISGISSLTILTVAASAAVAANIQPLQIMQNQLQTTKHEVMTEGIFSQLTPAQQEDKAKIWNLKVSDYKHYLWLMKNTPSSIWYKNLDPAEVLGLNTDSVSEREKYANISARISFQRVTRELAWQRMFTKAVKKQHQGLLPIEWKNGHSTHSNHFNAVQKVGVSGLLNKFASNINNGAEIRADDSFLLFVKSNNHTSNQITQDLINIIKKQPSAILNIYVVGNKTDQDIRNWAEQNKIPSGLVKSKRITLNHDNGRYNKMYKNGKEKMELPAVLLDRDGKFKNISINSIL